MAAMARFHDSRFQGVRLVCRLRRTNTNVSTGSAAQQIAMPNARAPSVQPDVAKTQPETVADASSGGPISALQDSKVKEKYFIVKSLTIDDLDLSVRNSVWATQAHNEDILNMAYKVRTMN